MTDAQLLAAAQQGDSEAWQALYERLLPSVWRAVHARVADRSAAEDIVSETFLALVRNLNQLDPANCRLHGWVLRVARNKVGDWARRRNCRTRALASLAETGPERSVVDPVSEALVDENRRLIVSVLDAMRQEHRTVLEMKYADELSVREIADRTGQTEKGVESSLFRARVEFRRKYEFYSKISLMPTAVGKARST